MRMPSVPVPNIPAKVRLWLYIGSALALPVVAYMVAKGWAGKEEVTLVLSLAALANGLAAAKTDLSEGDAEDVQGRHEAVD